MTSSVNTTRSSCKRTRSTLESHKKKTVNTGPEQLSNNEDPEKGKGKEQKRGNDDRKSKASCCSRSVLARLLHVTYLYSTGKKLLQCKQQKMLLQANRLTSQGELYFFFFLFYLYLTNHLHNFFLFHFKLCRQPSHLTR